MGESRSSEGELDNREKFGIELSGKADRRHASKWSDDRLLPKVPLSANLFSFSQTLERKRWK
jgi:hypothetical protein